MKSSAGLITLLLLTSFFGGIALSQALNEKPLSLMFYNMENYFDCTHDSLKNDLSFLPEGNYHWTWKRFWKKTYRMAEVLTSFDTTGVPDLMGFAEIENEAVLKCLMKAAKIENTHRYIYRESPDTRGIDVCFVYNRYLFKLLSTENIAFSYPGRPDKKSRDMMYVSGLLSDGRMLHLFICHWPSRYGGAISSEYLRCHAADILKLKVDSLFQLSSQANIIVMGDFNDEPRNVSVSKHLNALPDTAACQPASLYNLMWRLSEESTLKSHKYQGDWAMLDQIIVSAALYGADAGATKRGVFQKDFLLIPDKKYLGQKPFRTYNGYYYQGGYSDHLPVYLYLPFTKK